MALLLWAYLGLRELRGSALGGAVLTIVATVVVLNAAEIACRRRGWLRHRAAARPPRFGFQTWLALIVLAAAGFGIVECFYAPVASETLFSIPVGARPGPVSRWFFLVVIFSGALLYGASVLALGTGLASTRAAREA